VAHCMRPLSLWHMRGTTPGLDVYPPCLQPTFAPAPTHTNMRTQ